MRTLFRILFWLAAGLAGLGAGAAALGYYLVSRSLPDYGATHSIAGLDAEVEVVRDANAVPHIYASTEADAFFALGLVHAQERLWQMETARRGAQGRLSELFGAAALPLDRRMRALDLYGYARGSVPGLSERTRAALDAYSEGVNAWIREVNEEALGRGAPEFFVFAEGLSPWTPADSVAILKVMALRLTGAAANEVRRARLLQSVDADRIDDLFPAYPDAGVIDLPNYREAAARGATRAGLASLDAPARPKARAAADAEPGEAAAWLEAFFFPPPDRAGASNAWAVDGRRTTTGAPLLANDPHLWLSAPSVWMLAHVEFPWGGAIGGTVPGIPAIAVGRNRALAWGLTTVGMDDQDVYIEQVNPDDPSEYRTPSGWARFAERTETIRIRGGAEEVVTLRSTRHGPVMPPGLYDVGEVTPEGHVAALAWTALSAEDRGMDALMDLMRSTTVEEAVEAGAHLRSGAQNVTVADATGVGMFVAGRAPKRRADSRSQGRLPSLGWIAENDWDGLMDYESNPRSIRPASGVVANANNRTTGRVFPNHVSFDWDAPYRIRRIAQKLNDRKFHTVDSFIELQNDTVSEMARAVLPLVAR
ncbi:MAG: penicillin acylase family protein, partial [Pseudomonadota bacterium]